MGFFRELKEPLFTYRFYDDWMKFESILDSDKLLFVRKLFKQLPPLNRSTWAYTLRLLNKACALQAENLMSATNLAIVFAPNVLWKENGTLLDSKLESRVVTLLITFFIENTEDI